MFKTYTSGYIKTIDEDGNEMIWLPNTKSDNVLVDDTRTLSDIISDLERNVNHNTINTFNSNNGSQNNLFVKSFEITNNDESVNVTFDEVSDIPFISPVFYNQVTPVTYNIILNKNGEGNYVGCDVKILSGQASYVSVLVITNASD